MVMKVLGWKGACTAARTGRHAHHGHAPTPVVTSLCSRGSDLQQVNALNLRAQMCTGIMKPAST